MASTSTSAQVIHMSHEPPMMDDDSGGATTPPAGDGGSSASSKPARTKRKKTLDAGRMQRLFKGYAYEWGSNQAWDIAERRAILISNLRHSFGNDEVRMWMNSEKRRIVKHDEVVFDPSGECGPQCVNLWGGLAIEPKAGAWRPILDLLNHLCDENEEVSDWILNWVAYPLQKLGAKVPTAVIMHGDEGSGKNLFWDVVRDLYGEHGTIVGQDELEDKFNEWISQKCFVIGDEVLSRQEMRHLKGKLKAMISGTFVQINPKGLTRRKEANHMNLVLLSNELQPAALDASDRRMCVVWTPPKRERTFYGEVYKCLSEGGREAFLDALLKRDLSAFDPFAPPPMTRAKENLIDLGRPNPERFVLEWSGGTLPVAYNSCSTDQAYRLYKRWCLQEGERYPMAKNVFTRMAGRVLGDKLAVRVARIGVSKLTKMWLCTPPPTEEGFGAWAADCVDRFESQLKGYIGEQ